MIFCTCWVLLIENIFYCIRISLKLFLLFLYLRAILFIYFYLKKDCSCTNMSFFNGVQQPNSFNFLSLITFVSVNFSRL